MDTITLITGANEDLGHETARRLEEAGHTVVIGARDPERGRAAADALGVGLLSLDVLLRASEQARIVNAADPGYTRTDLNGGAGQHDVTEGTDGIVALATLEADGPTGTVINGYGVLPW